MTRDTATFIARLYIERHLHRTPATYEIIRCPEDDVRSKFFEFTTTEGDRIEVCIRPRDGIISSTGRSEDGTLTTHSATYRKVPLEEIFK
jgi:hypothetical protein